MATTPNASEARDSPSRTRRGIFVFGGTIMFALLAALATWLRDGEVAKVFVQGCLGIIELMVISYLFTTTLDRSEVLKNIGLGVRRYSGDPMLQPSYQQPPNYGYQQPYQQSYPPYQQQYPADPANLPPPSPDEVRG
jgi:hypothetical protein